MPLCIPTGTCLGTPVKHLCPPAEPTVRLTRLLYPGINPIVDDLTWMRVNNLSILDLFFLK